MPGDRKTHRREDRGRPALRDGGANGHVSGASSSGRELPHNLQAEAGLLACCIIDGADTISRCLEQKLSAEGFYSPAHRMVFEALLALNERNSAVDTILLSNELRDRGDLEAVGGISFIESLASYIETTAHAGHFIKIVQEKYLLRRLIRTATGTVERCYDYTQQDLDEFLGEIEREIFQIGEERYSDTAQPISQSVLEAIKVIHKLEQMAGEMSGLSTGFKDLDAYTWGLHSQELIVLAARPSMGKTSFALNMAESVVLPKRSKQSAVPALVFSLEMSAEQLALRMICGRAKVRSDRMRGGFLNRDEKERLSKAAVELKSSPLWIDDSSQLNIHELRAKARRLHSRHKLGLIVVDYLQLVAGTDPRVQREQQVAEISRGLKAMAKELRVPVIVLSQLNRESEREKREPRLSDLRESGAIEQDADVVLLLAKASDDGTQVAGEVAHLIIAKQRNGPVTGGSPIKLTFTREYTRFDDHASEQS